MAGERIVIVDDQMEATRLIQKNLELLSQEFQISNAFSGEEALLELSSGKTDLLIADFRLPGITGLELMERFKYYNPKGKVILISGVTDPNIRKQVAQAGADAFFFKPIDMPEFLDAVERALGMVETILPPELHLYSEEDIEDEGPDEVETQATMTEQISDLRATLDATAVLLVDDQGKVLVRAGDLPDPTLESSLMPILMRAFTAGVGISHFLGQHIPDHFLSFRGENYDLFLAPVGDPYCLMVLTRPILMQQLGSVAEQVHATARNVMLSLSRMGISSAKMKPPTSELVLEESKGMPQEDWVEAEPVAPESESEYVTETGSLADEQLESLFSGAGQGESDDVDAFWDSATTEDVKPELGNTDSLSYDQASKLGLAPDEK